LGRFSSCTGGKRKKEEKGEQRMKNKEKREKEEKGITVFQDEWNNIHP